jgi:flagellar basal body-associated protein FliL
MLTGMWILIAFVAAAIVGAIIIAVICFVVSKSKERKERAAEVQSQYAYSNYGGSQVGKQF